MSVFETTEPEIIRAALADQLQAVQPRLTWRQEARWTWERDAEIVGGMSLRSFDLIFGVEFEVTIDDRGIQGPYGGGIEFECPVVLRVSYPVKEAELPRYMGADVRDLTGLLVRLHESVPGLLPFAESRGRRVETTVTGVDGKYVGEMRFGARFFSDETVVMAP